MKTVKDRIAIGPLPRAFDAGCAATCRLWFSPPGAHDPPDG
jgi:hypothetical protein